MASVAAPLLTETDRRDVELSHRYRLSLESAPSQSSFRVLALLFYRLPHVRSNADGDKRPTFPPLPPLIPMARTTPDGRTYVVGTNDEPGYMGGAVCAERAAMVQLRFAPSPLVVEKIVISTDSYEPITPGMLCREFLAGHARQVPWDVPVVSSGNRCDLCAARDDALFQIDTSGSRDNVRFGVCAGRSDRHHSIRVLKTTLRSLYTYPSPYTRLSAVQSVALARHFQNGRIRYVANQVGDDTVDPSSIRIAAGDGTSGPVAVDEPTTVRLVRAAQQAAVDSMDPTVTNACDNHPIHFGCAALFPDGTVATSFQTSGLEYGCTLDAVSQMRMRMAETPPTAVVQTDQYGIVHSPFASARAFLTEHQAFRQCLVLATTSQNGDRSFHDEILSAVATSSSDANAESDAGLLRWKYVWIRAKELAPNPPSWTKAL